MLNINLPCHKLIWYPIQSYYTDTEPTSPAVPLNGKPGKQHKRNNKNSKDKRQDYHMK